jgi:hypothetical protein
MIVSLNFMGFDFIADFEYRVTSWGCDAQTYGPPENCYPAESPEWEINRIRIYRDVPLTAEEHRRNVIKTPIFEATGALFDCLADLDAVKDAIMRDAFDISGPYGDPDDRDYGRE